MDTSPEQLAIAIGKAMNGGAGTSYEALSLCQGGGHVERYAISANPRGFTWSATRLSDGSTQSFDPRTLTLDTDAGQRVMSIEQIPRSFPESVQLAFPLSLPIWGRDMDNYHPMAMEVKGADTTLLLRHRADPTIFGSFTFETESGIAKSYFTPSEVRKLERESKPDDGGIDFGFMAGHGQSLPPGVR
ncbi:hypothetical protein [Paenarthrobacter sp. NPDC057981]|uniref:hypothetical protein n=1 Tax=Paenarthrobacter sp. NPDC057981 TaxID=3346297 RepID=UPI0036DD1C05